MVLWGGLGLGLGGALVLAWKAPELLGLLPLAILMLAAGLVLFRYPTANLTVVLAGFVFAVNSDPGIQVTELIYGLYYYAFVFYWYGDRLRRGIPFVRTTLDRSLALFIVGGGSLGVVTGVLLGAPLDLLRGDLTAFLMLALYFPVKELCRTHRYGPEIIIGVLLWLGLFLSIHTFYLFRTVVQSATLAWQVADVRIGAIEALLLVACFTSLVLLLFTSRWRLRVGLLGLLLLLLGALILTRGRAFWVAFALGVGLFFLLLPNRQRTRLVGLTVVGTAGLVVVAFLFFGQIAELIFSGTLNRIMMIEAQDTSIQARFTEWRAVWDVIAANPILGYGFGSMYKHFDLVTFTSYEKHFVHNGYLAAWFKIGVLGLALLLFCWARVLFDAYRVYRNSRVPEQHRAFVLIAFVSLTMLALTTNTAIFFLVMDQIFAFALLAALVGGLFQRYSGVPAGTYQPSL